MPSSHEPTPSTVPPAPVQASDCLAEARTLPPEPPPAADLWPWPSVPGYEIVGELGRGGMGVVYQARQVAVNRPVALKMILAGDYAGEQHRARLRLRSPGASTKQRIRL
jgi:serine/threonine protein kinase